MTYSVLGEAVRWTESVLGVHAGTFPPADAADDFAVVTRVGGDVSYPHDNPRICIQIWAASESEGEQAALALARVLPSFKDADPRINSVTAPELVQMGREEGGRCIWELEFGVNANIRD